MEIPHSPTEVYSIIKQFIFKEWSQFLNKQPFKHAYRPKTVGLSLPDIYSNIQMIDRNITRLRLGTNLLPANKGRYILGTDPVCPQCGVELDTSHFLMDCGVSASQRGRFFDGLNSLNIIPTVNNILFPSKNLSKAVFKLLEIYILDCQATDKI